MSDANEHAALVRAALDAWNRRDGVGAERAARALLALRPSDADGHQILGALALQSGDVPAAQAHLRQAAAAAPRQPHIFNLLGQALRRLEDAPGARAAFARAGALGLGEAWRHLGELESAEGDFDAALTAHERAVAAEPASAPAHAALAFALERKHDLARAKAHGGRALALNPQSQTARLALGQIAVRERDYAGVREVLAPLIAAAATTPINRAIAYGMIGEAHDREGRPREAFAAFTAANQALLGIFRAYRDAAEAPFHPASAGRVARFLAREDFSRWPRAGAAGPAPVFLVGFPRSGTTLLDQILSSHSGVLCLEEKEILAPVVADLMADDAALNRLGAAPESEIAARRARYWQAAQAAAKRPIGARVLIDKLPLNLIFLPLIARVFPDAKIIFALRDPRDVILSCYQQRFGMNPAMAQLLALDTAAAYYDVTMNLAESAREKLALPVHQVRYEDVVGDLEGAARALAAFLDLPFEPAMLDFTATAKKRAINTPSARQVIEPLYNRSVGRWRAYAEDLAPVLPVLNAWAQRYGYDA